ncbi:MAG: carbohydrate ABC transporter substrate-binding protein [Chloroflexia bacterium]|nr:carbohydrate ABC transporter substrate-binding protein [Chloroflexia bacterium]
MTRDIFETRSVTRRGVVKAGAGIAGAAALAPLAGGRASVRARQDGGGDIVFLSTQLTPIEEAEAFRGEVLSGFEGEVEFVPEEIGPFNDRVSAEAEAGTGEVSLIGGQHGDFGSLAEQGLLMDLTDLATELADLGIVEEYLDLGKFGGEQQFYIPWMQATYVMAARREALEYLPEGLTEETLSTDLTYDQLLAWITAINEAEGPRFGLPAGESGLLHRFFQGYGYPSFTGALNTQFTSEGAVAMWQWLQGAWAVANPQSLSYDQMSEPLRSGEVWVAWDHTARLIDAARNSPDDIVMFPAPRGPEGLGFLPVVAGLAIPASAPNVEGARALIRYLTMPETQALTLEQVAFFPVIEGELPGDLGEGIQKEAGAVAATTEDEQALPSLLPVGLGDQGGAYNEVFRNVFQRAVVDQGDIQEALQTEAVALQEILDATGASCWTPDPESEGVCQVG